MSKLPEGWEVVKLGDICTINMGQSPKSETYNETPIGFPLIQGNADIKHRRTLPRIYTSELTKECNIGDIIMTVRAPVGAIAKSYHNACIGRGVCSIQAIEEKEFLYQFLLSYENKWDKLSQGSTFTAVNGSDIKNIKIPLPPLEEQKKIAEILSSVDQKIAFVDNRIEETELLKKGLMQKLLTEGIGHSEFKDSEIGRIPESWESGKVIDILTVKYGKSQKKVEDPHGDYPILGTGGLMGYANNYLYAKPSVLIGRKGTIDKPQYIEKPFWTVDTLFYTHIKSNNLPLFVYYLFLTIDWKKYNEASGVPSLSVSNIHNIKIPIPPLEEQKQIAACLSTTDEKLESLKEKKKSFEELKKGLMQKLLTGEVRV